MTEYAFPRNGLIQDGYFVVSSQEGMTLRDYFAAAAMQALITAGRGLKDAAEVAYLHADQMLKERAK
jgi:hypothetical protein